MKTFIAETVQVLLPAGSRPGRGCNRTAALRCALLALLTLGLLGGISQAQEPLVITPGGDANFSGNVGIGTNSVGDWPLAIRGRNSYSNLLLFQDNTGKARYHITLNGGGFNLAETGVKDYRLFIQAGTGNVGIGTFQTPNKLSVDGTGYFSGNVGIGKEPTTDKLSVDGGASFSCNVGIGKPDRSKQFRPSKQLDVVGDVAVSGEVAIAKKLSVTLGDDNPAGLGADKPGVEFRASNKTQGIGFGYNTIYAAGTWDGQDINLKPQTKGRVDVKSDLIVDNVLFVKGQIVWQLHEKVNTGGGKWVRLATNNWGGDYGTADSHPWTGWTPPGWTPSDTRLKTDLHP